MRMSYVLLAIVAIGCGGGGGDSGPTSPNPTPNPGGGAATASATVTITSSDDGYGYTTFAFSPTTVTITKGGTVTWNNTAGAAHNVTFMTAGSPSNVGTLRAALTAQNYQTHPLHKQQLTSR